MNPCRAQGRSTTQCVGAGPPRVGVKLNVLCVTALCSEGLVLHDSDGTRTFGVRTIDPVVPALYAPGSAGIRSPV